MFRESQFNPEKKTNEIFANEKCTVLSEVKEDTIIETIDYNDELRVLGFLMKNIEGEDVGYASFLSDEKEKVSININYLITKYITNLKEEFPESTKRALSNEEFEPFAAIKIYSDFKGKNFGRILFEYAMEYLSKQGFKELHVSSDVTAMDNPQKESFYKKIAGDNIKIGTEGKHIIDLEKWHENYLKNKQ
jgi:GNAT superfamily N-acetyltransferase